jgi:hypothetical protein
LVVGESEILKEQPQREIRERIANLVNQTNTRRSAPLRA